MPAAKERLLICCGECGCLYQLEDWQLKLRKGLYCSSKCGNKGKRNPNWRGGPTIKAHKRREYDLRRLYDMSIDDYIGMMDDQRGCCGCCGESLLTPESKQNMHVDHDHNTGATRDLLCTHCNRMLGAAKDSQRILEAGIRYVRRHK